MANCHLFFIFYCVILLTLSRSSLPVFDKPEDKLEIKQQKNDDAFVTDGSIRYRLMVAKLALDKQSPFTLQQTRRHNNEILGVSILQQAVQRQVTRQQSLSGNDHFFYNSSNTSSPSLHVQSLKPLLFKDSRHLNENRIIPTKKGTEKPKHKNMFSPGQNKKKNNKLWSIQEKSETLIKRLCVVGKSKRYLCYKSGSSNCYCIGGLADCSGKLYVPNISYAPKLPQDIKCLKFAYNNVRHLDDSYFSNVSKFVVIDFSLNTLESISSKTFQRFTNLKYLILNYNVIGYTYLRAVLDYPPKLRLDIIGLGLKNVTAGYFYNYSTIPTLEMYMDNNYIRTLDLQEFSKLKNLQYLSLTNSSIDQVISARMPNLKVLDLDYNFISIFPVTCNISIINSRHDINNTYLNYQNVTSNKPLSVSGEVSNQLKKLDENDNFSLYPTLTDLYIGSNNLLALPAPDEICLPTLKTLHIESNNITNIPENAFTSLRSLKVLILDNMRSGITNIGRSAFNISTLTSLHLSRNSILFGSSAISTQLFEGCSKLEILSIDHNKLGDVSENAFEELLNHTPALRSIYLSSTHMHFVPVKAFSQMRSIERLYFYVNEIKEIPPGAFDGMLSLRYLYMDENQISTVKENAFSPTTRHRLKIINLSRNEYLCDCNLLWFQSWLLTAGPALFMEFDNYHCSNINNMSVQGYVLSRQACLFSRETYILFVVCMSISMVIFIVFALLYRYRWNIRLMIYERSAPLRNTTNLSDEQPYRYDVFVVYCNDDSEWVEGLLIPMLETNWKLQACIHQRNFLAGGFIIDNIVESMNGSKRILFVISSRFALSRWCNFELQMCQSHVITHDLPSLLVIILDDVESRDMSAALLALYKTTCFLEWPAHSLDSRDMDTFWKRLETSLAVVIGKRSQGRSVKCVE